MASPAVDFLRLLQHLVAGKVVETASDLGLLADLVVGTACSVASAAYHDRQVALGGKEAAHRLGSQGTVLVGNHLALQDLRLVRQDLSRPLGLPAALDCLLIVPRPRRMM